MPRPGEGFMSDILPVGTPCPPFHLPSSYAKILDLKDYKGKKSLVLILYPEVNHPEATSYFKSVREAYGDIKALGAEVIAIGPDNQRLQSIYSYKNALPFPFLIDEAREHARMFNATEQDGKTIRNTVYVVDRGATIRLAVRGYPPVDHIVGALKGIIPPG